MGKKNGFTVIEAVIVLAIATLIFLIIFLAVPALKRSRRNTITKNDAQVVLGGVSDYYGNNRARLPATISGTGTVTYGPGAQTEVNVNGTTKVDLVTAVPAVGDGPDDIQPGAIKVYLGVACDGNDAVQTNPYSVAVFYPYETPDGEVVRHSVSN